MTDAYQSASGQTQSSHSATTADGTRDFPPIGPLTAELIALIEARGLDPETLVKLGVGSCAERGPDWIAIPYLDHEVRVGTKYRTLGERKLFSQDKGSPQILYNIDCLRDESLAKEPLILTEGELDLAAAVQAGFQRVVSVPGGAPTQQVGEGSSAKYAFLDHAAALLEPVSEIILATDGDSPGTALMHDLAARLGRRRCKWVTYPKQCKDLGDALRVYGARGVDAVRQTIARAQWYPVPGLFRLSQIPPDDRPAMTIGFPGLDHHYKIRRGDLCVVTGVPGMGKTAVINDIACRMVEQHGWNVCFASFEQSPMPDHRRALRSHFIGKGERWMDADEMRRADEWIERHFSFILPSDEEECDLPWLMERAATAVIRCAADLVVMDPWNEVEHRRPDGMSMTEYVNFALREIKRFARRHRVHFIVAAHPAKMQRLKGTDTYPIPSLYDISDSAAWSAKCDVGIIVHRESVVGNSDVLIRVAKTKYHNIIGKPGDVRAIFDIETSRYTAIESEID